MSVDVIVPQMGESIVEGTILKWLVKEGDHVEKEQPIVEISTDKIDTEVPSPVAGIVKKILHTEGEALPVQTVIAHIEAVEKKEESVVSEKKPEVIEEKKRVESLQSVDTIEREERRYSPLVRKIAGEYGVTLENVKGTGEGGRVTKKDILDYVASRTKPAPAPVAEGLEKTEEREILIPFNLKRLITAERMAQSKQTAVHVTTVFEVDMTNVARYRELNKQRMKNDGIHLTYLPFISFATAHALKAYPLLNSSWTDNGLLQKNYINIGIAVSLEDGLIVPVIKDADKKELKQLSREIQDIAINARSKKLKPDDVQGGTFTITNHGLNGSLIGTPIILQPQVAILGVGAVQKRPVVVQNDAIAIRTMMYLSLSFDHRVMDGANADMFLLKIKDILEGWEVESHEHEKEMSAPPGGYGGVW
ncbi:MAG: 2-oxo acid dehydrogenase subunit E2 [Candidatus Brocadiaceae bacterium]|nr:2-oxo acid dehydrogenase subunit E2 [Candidatus Brocadiaceae bacterium]